MGEFYFSYAFIVMSIALLPESIAVIMSLRGFLQTGYHHFLYMFLTWSFLLVGNFFLAIAYFTLDFTLYKLGVIASVPLMFSIMVLVDSLSRDHIDPFKLFIVSIIATSVLIFAFEPDAVILHQTLLDETTPSMQGNFMLFSSAVFIVSGFMWVYYMTKIHISAPKSIKKYSKINLSGALIAGPGSAIAFASGFVWIFPGTDYMLIGIGALLCSYSFVKQPKLGYVLPFNVYRLLVIDTNIGMPIYSFTWDSHDLMDSLLFSGAFHGIIMILNESLSRGLVKEITLDQGKLLLKQADDIPLVFVLIASKSHLLLKQGLE
ncbi:MAG: hypothetical protein ACTSR2_14800, partial [Candidatus Hodarchaeales archaeon]